jgi:hypothetical protein
MRGNKELTEKLLKVLLTEKIKFKVKNVGKSKYEVIIFNKKNNYYEYVIGENETIIFHKHSIERQFKNILPTVEIKII